MSERKKGPREAALNAIWKRLRVRFLFPAFSGSNHVHSGVNAKCVVRALIISRNRIDRCSDVKSVITRGPIDLADAITPGTIGRNRVDISCGRGPLRRAADSKGYRVAVKYGHWLVTAIAHKRRLQRVSGGRR